MNFSAMRPSVRNHLHLKADFRQTRKPNSTLTDRGNANSVAETRLHIYGEHPSEKANINYRCEASFYPAFNMQPFFSFR